MCTFGVLGPGFHTTEKSKRAHLTPPALQTPPKFHEKIHNERQKERNWWWERKKKARNFGPPTLLAPNPSDPTFSGFGPPPFRASTPSEPHHPTCQPPPKKKLAKCGLAKFLATLNSAKEVGQMRPVKFGQIRFGPMRFRPNGRAQYTMAKNGFGQKRSLPTPHTPNTQHTAGSPGATSEVSAVAIGQRSSTSGSFRALATTQKCHRSATSWPQTHDESRHRARDGSHEGVQTRESIGGDGRSPRASRGASESWTRSGRRNKFLWSKLRSVSRDWWTSNPGAPRPTTCSRDVLEDQTIHLVVKKQAVSRQASSRRDALGRIPLMPCHVPNDVTNWLEDRQADFQDALTHGDVRSLPELSRLLSEGSRHLAELCPQPSSVANMVT